ncbi:MAG: M50 family metallopeptidase [Actinomycetota bacterium]|nr:M50 family metallopeptidase [Actinomycetota bacterium]
MHDVERIWVSIVSTQQRPPTWVVAASAALALLMVVDRRLWPLTRHLITTAHEGAHGLAALLTGRRLSGIRLHSDSSGVAVSKGRASGPGMVLMLLAGYIGPGLLGLGAAALLVAGYAVALLWWLLALLAGLLVQIRNWFGLWSILVTVAVVFVVSWFADEQVQSAFAYLATWFLLLGAPRPVIELYRSRRRGRCPNSDADQLSRMTRIPVALWIGVFLVVTVGALCLGAWWLIDA